MELASCHPSGTQNLEMAPGLPENLCTSGLSILGECKNILSCLSTQISCIIYSMCMDCMYHLQGGH
jgi:hypothetical protein